VTCNFKKVNYDLKPNISLCECTSFLDANGDTIRYKLQRFDNCEIRTLHFIDIKIRINDQKLKCAILNKHDVREVNS